MLQVSRTPTDKVNEDESVVVGVNLTDHMRRRGVIAASLRRRGVIVASRRRCGVAASLRRRGVVASSSRITKQFASPRPQIDR
jgi:hypothetical protein